MQGRRSGPGFVQERDIEDVQDRSPRFVAELITFDAVGVIQVAIPGVKECSSALVAAGTDDEIEALQERDIDHLQERDTDHLQERDTEDSKSARLRLGRPCSRSGLGSLMGVVAMSEVLGVQGEKPLFIADGETEQLLAHLRGHLGGDSDLASPERGWATVSMPTMSDAVVTLLAGLGGALIGATAALTAQAMAARQSREAERRRELVDLVARLWDAADRVWRHTQGLHIAVVSLMNAQGAKNPDVIPIYEEHRQSNMVPQHAAETEGRFLVAQMRLLHPFLAEPAGALMDASGTFDLKRLTELQAARQTALEAYELAARSLLVRPTA